MKKLFITLLFVLSSTFSFADDDHEHKHNMVEANAPYPTLDVELIKDTKDGYNLIIQTTNFKFAPENVNQANNGNEGHALSLLGFISILEKKLETSISPQKLLLEGKL
jgi:hypothetical protein